MLVPSKSCRNDVIMVIFVFENVRVKYTIAYFCNKEIVPKKSIGSKQNLHVDLILFIVLRLHLQMGAVHNRSVDLGHDRGGGRGGCWNL